MASSPSPKEEEEISTLPRLEFAKSHFPRHSPKSIIPIVRGVIGIGLFALSAIIIDNKYFNNFSMIKLPKYGWFLLLYLIGIFVIRIKETRSTSICYELYWGCNIGLFICGIGCIYGRPLLVGISIGLVGLDQTIWYLDIISFLLRRKYLIGAAGYLSHPEQTYIRSITSLHHLWFLPYSMYCLFVAKSYLHSISFPLSMSLGLLSMLCGRFFAPKFCWMPLNDQIKGRMMRHKNAKKKHHSIFHCMVDKDYYLEYLNINCGHEFYPTVPISILHYFNRKPFYLYIPFTAALLTFASYFPFFLMQRCSKRFLWE